MSFCFTSVSGGPVLRPEQDDGLEDRFDDLIYYFIKIRLTDNTELANYVALGVAGNDLALHITRLAEIASTHSFFQRIAILRINIRLRTNQHHVNQTFLIFLQCVIGHDNSRVNFDLSIRKEEINLYNVALFVRHN